MVESNNYAGSVVAIVDFEKGLRSDRVIHSWMRDPIVYSSEMLGLFEIW
jgi:hypothetical protein